MRNKTNLNQETGLVSLIVTMILMIVISLVVLGFAQIARREQRQALDQQLSNQAFYAAESGVNDAVKAISAKAYNKDKLNCSPDGPFTVLRQNLGNNISYTCLLISQSPTSLEYSDIDTDKSTIIPINATDGSNNPLNPKSLTISWQAKDGAAGFRTSDINVFPVVGSWGSNSGVLRTTVIPTASVTRNSLINNSFTTFLYPKAGSGTPGTINYSNNVGPTNGSAASGNCNGGATPKYCSVVIDNLPAISNFYLRLKSIYKSSSVTITGETAGGTPIHFQGAQIEVDSTGKAKDVLRRIKVRVASQDSFDYPEYVLDSRDTICKQLSVWPGGYTATGPDCEP